MPEGTSLFDHLVDLKPEGLSSKMLASTV